VNSVTSGLCFTLSMNPVPRSAIVAMQVTIKGFRDKPLELLCQAFHLPDLVNHDVARRRERERSKKLLEALGIHSIFADTEGTLDFNVRHDASLSIKADELEACALSLLADLVRVESDRVQGCSIRATFLMRVVLPIPGLPVMRKFFTRRCRAYS